ncbi:MAG: L-histidine N(alpha)-methyltransferase [Pseudomarimonas sp.]
MLDYRDPSARVTPLSGLLTHRLRQEIGSCDLFFMLIGSDAGSPLEGDDEDRGALDFELTTYEDLRNSGRKKSAPFIVSYNTSKVEPSRNLIKLLNNIKGRGLDSKLAENRQKAIALMVEAFNYLKYTTQQNTITGFLDVDNIHLDIARKLADSISTNSPFPQKYLYATPVGAQYWVNLTRGNSSAIGTVYQKFMSGSQIPDEDQSCVDWASQKLVSLVEKDSERKPPGQQDHVCVLVLGCGDAKREAYICGTLKRKLHGSLLRVLLVDVSKTLISTAATEFRNQIHGDIDVRFAIVDFERPAALKTIRQRWAPQSRVIVLFLGNTFGNINSSVFLNNFETFFRPGDIAMIETAKASNTSNTVQTQTLAFSPDDKRFDFFTSPLLMMGLTPVRMQLQRRTAETSVGEIETFRYIFSENDEQTLINSEHFQLVAKGHYIDLCSIQRFHTKGFEAMMEATFPVNCVHERAFTLTPSSSITMLYGFGML